MGAEGIRLNKYLTEAGVCSRREADRLTDQGRVLVNGQKAFTGQRILPGQTVTVSGQAVTAFHGQAGHKAKPVLLAVHKPRGIVCTTSEKDRAPNIVDMIGYPTRIYPVGRLDKDSEGLILMTNQGDLVNKIMRSGNIHEKEYYVKVDRPFSDEFIQKMKQGVYLPELSVTTKPCVVTKINERTFRMILTQGLNRQIRRMCSGLGYEVRSLKRVRIMKIELGDLKPGAYRTLTQKEYGLLMEALKGSTNLSYEEQKKGDF